MSEEDRTRQYTYEVRHTVVTRSVYDAAIGTNVASTKVDEYTTITAIDDGDTRDKYVRPGFRSVVSLGGVS